MAYTVMPWNWEDCKITVLIVPANWPDTWELTEYDKELLAVMRISVA